MLLQPETLPEIPQSQHRYICPSRQRRQAPKVFALARYLQPESLIAKTSAKIGISPNDVN